jgi:hypothetical protein
MTVHEPLPGTAFGKADWQDYTDYWREVDSEWLMQRSILRYANTTTRAVDWPSPVAGQVTYNDAIDRVEYRSKTTNSWVPLLVIANLGVNLDSATQVGIGHSAAGGKGMVFELTRTVFDNPIYVMGGVLTTDATGVTVKTHATKAAKLTTDVNGLVSDSQITAPTLAATGAVTAATGTITTLTAPNITMTGTLTGGVVNGSSGTIGGVAHSANKVTAASGFDSSGGAFYGDAGSAIMRPVNRTGPYVQAHAGGVNIGGGGVIDILANSTMRVFTNAVQYIRSDGVHTGYLACSFWGDPGVGNCPEGSIMMQ